MILDLNADFDTNDKVDRILHVFLLGLVMALIARFVESVYKTTLLQ